MECTADEAGKIAAASAVFLALTNMQAMTAKAAMAAIRRYFNLTSRYFFILTSCWRSLALQALVFAALSSSNPNYSHSALA